MEVGSPPPCLALHVRLAPDTTLAAALAAAGLTPEGPVGLAEVWVTFGVGDPGVRR